MHVMYMRRYVSDTYAERVIFLNDGNVIEKKLIVLLFRLYSWTD